MNPPKDAKWGVKISGTWKWFVKPDPRNIALEIVDSHGYLDDDDFEVLSSIAYGGDEEE